MKYYNIICNIWYVQYQAAVRNTTWQVFIIYIYIYYIHIIFHFFLSICIHAHTHTHIYIFIHHTLHVHVCFNKICVQEPTHVDCISNPNWAQVPNVQKGIVAGAQAGKLIGVAAGMASPQANYPMTAFPVPQGPQGLWLSGFRIGSSPSHCWESPWIPALTTSIHQYPPAIQGRVLESERQEASLLLSPHVFSASSLAWSRISWKGKEKMGASKWSMVIVTLGGHGHVCSDP